MPRLFPYNKFTMTVRPPFPLCRSRMLTRVQKLIKRTIWREHTNLLLDRQNEQIEQLRVLAHEGFPKAREDWERSVMQWGASSPRPHTSLSHVC